MRQSKTIFNKAVAWGYIKTNPFEDITIGKIRTADWHYITPEQFQSIIDALNSMIRKGLEEEDKLRSIRLKAFYAVMYGCGLRFGEAANLTWDSHVLDFESNHIIVTDRKATKTTPPFFVKDYESRIIPMPAWVIVHLKELEKISKNNNHPYVFLNNDCFGRVSSKWKTMVKDGKADQWKNRYMMHHALRQFKRYCERAGIETNKKLNLHCLRKAYGTNLVKIGTDAKTLKDLMGHSSVLTSMKFYVSSIDANKKLAVERLDRLMG